MTHEAHEGRPPLGRPRPHRLLCVAGFAVAAVAVLAHLAGGGAALLHLGPGAAVADLGGGTLAIGVAALVAVKLLVIFGARRWFRHR